MLRKKASVYVSKLLWECPSGKHRVCIHTPPPVTGWESLATLEDSKGNIIAIDINLHKEWKECGCVVGQLVKKYFSSNALNLDNVTG